MKGVSQPFGVFMFLVGTVISSEVLVIRQSDSLGNATLSLLDDQDTTLITSDLSFPYQAPLVEATGSHDAYYVVSYPSDDPNGVAHLWKLDANLTLVQEWVQPADGLSFFDLQYSSLQDKLFGIAVNGTYGRIISHINITGSEVTAEYLVSCPYMWYVNASTFDHENDIYYAILNNFEDPSLGQKIMVVNVANGDSNIYDYDPLSAGLLYYISFSSQLGLVSVSNYVELDVDDDDDDDDVEKGVGQHLRIGCLSFYNTTASFGLRYPIIDFSGKYSPIAVTRDSNNKDQVMILAGSDWYQPQNPPQELYMMDSIYLYARGEIASPYQGNAAAIASFVL